MFQMANCAVEVVVLDKFYYPHFILVESCESSGQRGAETHFNLHLKSSTTSVMM